MAAGLVGRDGELFCARRAPTPTTGDAEELFAVVAGLVGAVLAEPSVPGTGDGVATVVCGVGCGGPMDLVTGSVSPLNIPAWRAFPLRPRLEELTGLRVALDNDAKAFALAEGWTGAASRRRHFLAMVVSTG